jgi:hypothetical protein
VVLAALLASATASAGCGAIALAALGAAAGTAAAAGVSYTFDGIAYRTFTAPLDDVRQATEQGLHRMDITIVAHKFTQSGREIRAEAGDRSISIELESLTARATRMRVTAKHHTFIHDRSTAGEIVAQTQQALDTLLLTKRVR